MLNKFSHRHIGPRKKDIDKMLGFIKAESISQLIDETIPQTFHLKSDMKLPNALTENRFAEHMKKISHLT